MSFMDIFKKLFANNNQVKDIMNINDTVHIPKREYFEDKQEVIKLIDKYKDEYIRLLSGKKIRLSRELSFDNIQNEIKMYVDLLLRICIKDDEVIEKNEDEENKNINMMVQMTKLEFYLKLFDKQEKDVITRLVSLKEVMDEHKWLYLRNRNVINEEVNNLSRIMIMFMKQRVAIEKEIDAYFKEIQVQTIRENLSVNKKEKLIKDKLDELLWMAKELIPDEVRYIEQLSCSDIVKLSYLEKEIEIYVYKNKNVVDSLKEELELLNREEKNKQNKDKLLGQIKKLENKYKLFYKYGRGIITNDDMYDLYRVKFDIMTIDICGKNPSFIIDSNGVEHECYKDVVFKKLEKIYRGENEVIKTIFGNDSVKAIKAIKNSLKLGYGEHDIEWVMNFYLDYVLAFDKEDGFREYLLKHKRDRNKYDLNYYDNSFEWEDSLPLDTLFYLGCYQKNNGGIKKDSFEWYLFILYKFMQDYEKGKDEYRLPYGLVGIYFNFRFDFDCSLVDKIAVDAIGKIVIFPNSLRTMTGDIFYMGKISGIELNQGLEYVNLCVFAKHNLEKISLPPSVKTFYTDVYTSRIYSFNNLVFEDFRKSEVLNNIINFASFIRKHFVFNEINNTRYLSFSKEEENLATKILKITSCEQIYKINVKPKFQQLIFLDENGFEEVVIDKDMLKFIFDRSTLDDNSFSELTPENCCAIIDKINEIIERDTGYKFGKVKKLER